MIIHCPLSLGIGSLQDSCRKKSSDQLYLSRLIFGNHHVFCPAQNPSISGYFRTFVPVQEVPKTEVKSRPSIHASALRVSMPVLRLDKTRFATQDQSQPSSRSICKSQTMYKIRVSYYLIKRKVMAQKGETLSDDKHISGFNVLFGNCEYELPWS